MQIGKVTGSLWATRKDEKLNGLKLLLVEICTDEMEDVRHSIVAADNAGAGNGDLVLVTTGSAARASTGDNTIPVDACIVGIIDSVERYG
ncbi:ethanolamine utilization protein EutN [Listeria monocytogenes]|uniref:EutN/CcmL family microcompartment protein n=1 Tax=Listeria monocytogenes TaxID=1639 RepID=UPI000F0FAFD1|nr:EutN/CcmL family microcompartment protein [Listeria monocytogenes]EAD3234877.1 ethanolamine utilization protein EutN [Listeria monocytogenes CFSAN002202]EAG9422932.1 ethanolamine utilization protein EutN [Listeria monocytogenes CFSAN002184]EAG9459800.1 ethanolamine utilization protein EutN [Listeria monocytogenes CFSAN002208]ECT1641005.1 ethanolamine utilization protein EutN [Listeria monocytogenes CFSAN002191]EAC3023604.1 ethanolamine utilization protein EutN [Listeria monocytogenes]